MLTKIESITPEELPVSASVAIVASLYNKKYVDGLVEGALEELKKAPNISVWVIRVPGAYEIPIVASRLAAGEVGFPCEAVICLGVIIKGETAHADLIGRAVTDGLMQLQLKTAVPMIHEVLLVENEKQAYERCLTPEHNRGREAALTALRMIELLRRLSGHEVPHLKG